MKKIDIYISKLFIKYFLLALTAFISVILLTQIFKIVSIFSNNNSTVRDIFMYVLVLLPEITINVAPLSVIIGGLITTSIMAKNFEIISLKASGIRFLRIIRYPVMISFIISILVFFLYSNIYPKTMVSKREMRGYEVKNRVVPKEKNNVFYKDEEEDVIYFMKYLNRETGKADMLQIIEINDEFTSAKKILNAKSGEYDFEKKIWIIKDVYIHNIEENSTEFFKNYSSDVYYRDPNEFIKITGASPEYQTNKELISTIKEGETAGLDVKEYVTEIGRRLSFPFTNVIVSIIGLALGSSYVRKSKNLNVVLCLLLGYGYYILNGLFKTLGESGSLNPILAAWFPNIIFFVLGIYLLNNSEY